MDSSDHPQSMNRRVFIKGVGYVSLGLVFSSNPCATPADLRAVLRGNAVDIGTNQAGIEH